MAKYKKYSKKQKRFIPISFEDQILPGTFEFALDYLSEVGPIITGMSYPVKSSAISIPASITVCGNG